MASIEHEYAEQPTGFTQQTSNLSWTDVTGVVLSTFTATKKYLIVGTAHQGCDVNTAPFNIRLVHGSGPTEFTGSQFNKQSTTSFLTQGQFYFFWDVWTAVSGESVKMQFRSEQTGATIEIHHAQLFSICLSDDLTEDTDWMYASSNPADSPGTTWEDGASGSITPENANDLWLVLSRVFFDTTGKIGAQYATRCEISEGSTTIATEPEDRMHERSISLNESFCLATARAIQLSDALNTFTSQYQSTLNDSTCTVNSSAVFALNLNKFQSADSNYTAAELLLTANSPYQDDVSNGSVSVTPTETSDVYALTYWIFDTQNRFRWAAFATKADGSELPVLQESTDMRGQVPAAGGANIDEMQMVRQSLKVDSAADTAVAWTTVGRASSTTDSPAAEDRSLIAWTMQLAAAAGPDVPPAAQSLYLRRRVT